ncbi:hypothetical protein KCV00_g207, partial [Aureobasidium melanogenum]
MHTTTIRTFRESQSYQLSLPPTVIASPLPPFLISPLHTAEPKSEYAPFAWSLYHNQSQAKHEGQDDILVEHGSQLFFGGHCGRLVMLKSKPESVPDKFEKRVDGDNLGFHSLTLKRDSRTFFTGGAPIPSALLLEPVMWKSVIIFAGSSGQIKSEVLRCDDELNGSNLRHTTQYSTDTDVSPLSPGGRKKAAEGAIKSRFSITKPEEPNDNEKVDDRAGVAFDIQDKVVGVTERDRNDNDGTWDPMKQQTSTWRTSRPRRSPETRERYNAFFGKFLVDTGLSKTAVPKTLFMNRAATVSLLAATSFGVAAAKYETFAIMYKTPHMPNPRGPAIFSVLTGFLTSFRTYAAFDHPAPARNDGMRCTDDGNNGKRNASFLPFGSCATGSFDDIASKHDTSRCRKPEDDGLPGKECDRPSRLQIVESCNQSMKAAPTLPTLDTIDEGVEKMPVPMMRPTLGEEVSREW